MPHVVVAGPVSWNTMVDVDALPRGDQGPLFARGHRDGLGGTSAGKALSLARLGVDVTLRTALGDDDAAAEIDRALAHPRLTLAAAWGHGPSERHLNLMAADGGRLSIYLHLPPDPGPVPPAVRDAVIGADVVVVDLAEHAREVLRLAAGTRREVWCDLHDWDGEAEFQREFADAATVLLVSEDRLADPRSFLAARVEAGARWAVCTRGARGVLALGRDEGWLELPAVPVARVADTNGAGDAFAAGMLLGHLEARPLEVCLRLGAAAGALAVQSLDLVAPDLGTAAVRTAAGLA
jgi:sugar/nucleoside kinase (ribokinase family)